MKSIKEIIEAAVGEVGRCLRAISSSQLEAAMRVIDEATRIFIAGSGRSGLAVRAFAMRLMHLGKTTFVVGDVTTPNIQARDLLVIGSGSGSTPTVRIHAEKAKTIGAQILLFTIVPDSPIGSIADLVVTIPAPSPKSVKVVGTTQSIQPMGSLFEQSLFVLGDLLILGLMENGRLSSEEMFKRHANLE